MKFVTYNQYSQYIKSNNNIQEKKIEKTYENLEYNQKKVKQIDKRHDKMFRNILSNKKEMVKLLNGFLELKEEIEEKKLVQCKTDFITKNYRDKQSDIIYKLKDEPIYFLLEHQSTINKNMSIKIGEYIGEILRKEKIYLNDESIYPVVIPLVIYTGYQKWNAKTNFAEKQYQSLNYKKYQINLEYNLIAVQNYTFEELLEKRSMFANIMMIEKCKTIKEVERQLNRIIQITEENDKEQLMEIIVNIIAPIIGEEKTEKMLKKLSKEEIGMSPFTKIWFDAEIKGRKEGRKEGMKEGMKEGIKKGEEKGKSKTIKEIVKKMLEVGETEDKIITYLGISKKELEKIKGIA